MKKLMLQAKNLFSSKDNFKFPKTKQNILIGSFLSSELAVRIMDSCLIFYLLSFIVLFQIVITQDADPPGKTRAASIIKYF